MYGTPQMGSITFGPAPGSKENAGIWDPLPETESRFAIPPVMRGNAIREPQPPVGYVVGFCFSPDYEYVALIRKNKPEWQAGKLNGIGGKIEAGERKGIAMSREFHEEAGVLIPEMHWLHIRTEFFNSGQEAVRKQQSGAKVHHFAYCATDDEWLAIKTQESEEVEKHPVSYIADGSAGWETIYNLPYLVPMARILLQQPAYNRPLP